MKANYGYKDGSGEYFITIDTDKCNSCGDCAKVCPPKVIVMITNDYDEVVPAVSEEHRKKIKYDCAPCKPVSGPRNIPCITSCKPVAITHSW